jgi:sensor histidine kinase YesM
MYQTANCAPRIVITRKVVLREIRDVLILAVLGFLMTYTGVSCRKCVFGTDIFWIVASYTTAITVFMWKGNSYIASLISLKVSWIERPVLRFIIGLVATIVYSIGIMFVMSAVYYSTTDLDFSESTWGSIIITIFISSVMHAREFLLSWRKSIINAERLEKENIAARYESLKAQINPHFLFNTLNTLTNVVYEDQDKAAKFIKQLSEVYRYVLDTRDKEVVDLAEELKFLHAYLYLQQIRFGDRLKLDIDLNGVNSKVAPLVLQMLIENAIKHNIVSQENPLHIRVYRENDFIVVENNLQRKMVFEEDSTGLGLENICRRYEFLDRRPVQIIQNDKFIVKLPLLSVAK